MVGALRCGREWLVICGRIPVSSPLFQEGRCHTSHCQTAPQRHRTSRPGNVWCCAGSRAVRVQNGSCGRKTATSRIRAIVTPRIEYEGSHTSHSRPYRYRLRTRHRYRLRTASTPPPRPPMVERQAPIWTRSVSMVQGRAVSEWLVICPPSASQKQTANAPLFQSSRCHTSHAETATTPQPPPHDDHTAIRARKPNERLGRRTLFPAKAAR